MAGIYVHIPFCRRKCHYCAFVSYTHTRPLEEAFVEALLAEMELAYQGLSASRQGAALGPFETIYIGGGTPSVLEPSNLALIIDAARRLAARLGTKRIREITVEANPESVSPDFLTAFKAAGCSRLSIGVQDMTDEGLRILGRIHGVGQARKAFELSRRAGVENISLDLIYAICAPARGQDPEWLSKSLNRAASLGPDHVSCYELTIEPNTRLAEMVMDGTLEPVGHDEAAGLMELVEGFWREMGLPQYEISNFAAPGRHCLHNMNYWLGGDYLGLGPGAHSHFSGIRSANVKGLASYMKGIETGRLPRAFEERLDREARFRECFVTSMRLTAGVDSDLFTGRFGIDPLDYYRDELSRFQGLGLFSIEYKGKKPHPDMERKGLQAPTDRKGARIGLTRRGRRVFNSVMCHFI